VQDNWQLFKDTILAAIESYVPKKKVQKRQRHTPWFSDELRQLTRNKANAYKHWKQTNQDKHLYLRLQKKTRKAVAAARRLYYEKVFTEIGSHKFWQHVRSLTVERESDMPSLTNTDGEVIASTDQQRATALSAHFQSEYQAAECDPPVEDEDDPSPVHLCPLPWLRHQLRRLDVKKSTGPDEISPLILSRTADAVVRPLLMIINKSLSTGDLPSDWKAAAVRPILKKGAVSSKAISYRPIAITSIAAKLCERWVKKCLEPHIDHHLPPWQYGFRTKRGTIEALLDAEASILAKLEAAGNGEKSVTAVSFYISKAFDSISH
jgi:hypothetical protein